MKAFIARHTPFSEAHNDYQNYDFEGDLSIDQHIKEEAKEFQISIGKEDSGEGTPSNRHNLKEMLNKAKTFYTASWNDVQTYVRSLTGTSLEELDAQASTAENLEENPSSLQSLDSTVDAKKKWVVYDMVKLGFRDEQIRDAVEYLDEISEEMSREEMLKRTIDHLVDQRRSYDHVVEIDTDTQKIVPIKSAYSDKWNSNEPTIVKMQNLTDKITTKKAAAGSLDLLEEKDKGIEAQDRDLGTRTDTVSCPICFEDFNRSNMKHILNCSHSFCKNCYTDYITEQINAGKVLSISCPSEGCQQVFQEDQIRDLIDTAQMERYLRFQRVASLNLNPNLRWCIRPGCDKYVIGKKGMKKIACQCGMEMCFKCGNQYHFGKSCEAAIDKVYKKYVKEQNVQNCPQCQSRTEKSGGCHHITCTRCKYEWCWLCMKRYEQDHYSATNPNHCPKIEINADDGRQQEEYVRETYCSRMIHDPMLILAFPLFLVIMSAMVPQYLFSKYMTKKKGRHYDFNLENGTGMMLLFALLGIAFIPVSIVFMFGVVMIDGIVDLYLWIYKKAKGREMGRKPRALQPNVM